MQRKQKFEMLGIVLNEKGNCDDAVASQLANAQGTFWSMAYIFKNRCIPREVRFKKYVQLVASVALHGAGSWVWTTKIANQFQTFENKCLRIICNFTRETFNDELENWVVWIRRTFKMARNLYMTAGHPSITEKTIGLIFNAARSVIKMPKKSAAAVALSKTLAWRDTSSWILKQQTGDERDATFFAYWKHATRGRRVQTWDSVLVFVFGIKWRESFTNMAVSLKQLREHFQAEAFSFIGIADPRVLREERMRKAKKKEDLANTFAEIHVEEENRSLSPCRTFCVICTETQRAFNSSVTMKTSSCGSTRFASAPTSRCGSSSPRHSTNSTLISTMAS